FFFSSRRRHTRFSRDWSSDVCSSDLQRAPQHGERGPQGAGGQSRRRRRVGNHRAQEGLGGGAVFRFTEEEIRRYSRNIILQEVGGIGQQKLKDAKVLVVGAGGLGSPAAFYLAAAGVGTIGIVDDDVVDLSNLQRQILHRTEDVGTPKVDSAARALSALNPGVQVKTYRTRLGAGNVMDIIRE